MAEQAGKIKVAALPQLHLVPLHDAGPGGMSNHPSQKKLLLPSWRDSAAPAAAALVPLPKLVREYPLPGARQTHEMALLPDHSALLVSQQTNSTLLLIHLHPLSRRPTSVHRFLVGNFWAGLHGLSLSRRYPDAAWATLQFANALLRLHIDPSSGIGIQQAIPLPASVQGPHCIIESGDFLWVTCKDSSHVVRVNHTLLPRDYDDDEGYGLADRFSIYPTSRRPIFVAVHGRSGDVYASLDLDSKIWRLDSSTGSTSEIDIPASRGNTPVGLVTGPDGNVWFSMLCDSSGGKGSFARISESGQLKWFHLNTPVGKDAGLIHLAFDFRQGVYDNEALTDELRPITMWLLGSTLLSGAKGVDAIFSVVIDPMDDDRIQVEHSISFPTQRCASHRVLSVPNAGLFVSQLSVSSLAHIDGSVVLRPLERKGEITDYYACFGEGVPRSHYIFAYDEESAEEPKIIPLDGSSAAAITWSERPKKRPYKLAASSA